MYHVPDSDVMMSTKRLFILVMICCGLLTGCTSDSSKDATEPPPLRVGVSANYPPFELIDTASGEPVGFDLDLMSEIARRNDWRCTFVDTPFVELLPAVMTRSLAAAISAISITPRRQTMVAFSDPYYLAGQAILVRASDTLVEYLTDLRGKRVGVLGGSTSESIAQRSDGLLVFPYHTVDEAVSALLRREIDAVLNDHPTSRIHADTSDALRLIVHDLDVEFYGIALPRTDTIRLEAIDATLAQMMGDGTVDSLHVKWFGRPMMDEIDSVIAEDSLP